MSDRTLPDGLVVFMFGPNECELVVTDTLPDGLSVCSKTETWNFGGLTHPIGTEYVPSRLVVRHNHVIGVFDRRQLTDLQRMVRVAIEIERDDSHGAHG